MRSAVLGDLGGDAETPAKPILPSLPAALFPFGAACLAAEAGLIAAIGAGLRGCWPGTPELGGWAVPAFAYVVLAALSGAFPRPSQASTAAAARAVLALFVVAAAIEVRSPAELAASLAWCAGSVLGVTCLRSGAVRLARQFSALRPAPRPVAFIGNSASAARMLRQLQADAQHRALPVGYFDDRNRPGPLDGVLPCLGGIEDLVGFIHDHELHDVYMALPWSAGERISVLIDRLRFLPLTVRLVPDQAPPVLRAAEGEQLEGVVMPTLMLPPFSALGAVLKRSCDLALAGLLMIPLSVLFLLVALVIRLDSRGPVFFRQVRSGQYGRPFQIFKFRSLHVAQADDGAETLVSRGDTRVTRVGRYLRKYSIDELPQILNVLLGDMSLVGPRPHAPRAKADGRIYAEVLPDYMLRYRVKPGMTGWAQVNGWRGNTDTEDKLRKRVEYDFDYIKHWSMARDFLILLRTVPSVLAPPPENA